MKRVIYLFVVLSALRANAQESQTPVETQKKGSFYFYWGWNHSAYSNSDIHFSGNGYDFTIYDVIAKDRQSPFDLKVYLNPATITIPQYNFRVGYFFHEKYNLSFGADHMKYVMVNNQNVKMSGTIENSGTVYDGTYNQTDFNLSPDFLKFEHTDGLNYLNLEVRRFDKLYSYKRFNLNLSEGFGAGILYPRTNTSLMNNARYDQFHLAGYGLGAVIALNVEIYDRFFVQTELKGGFIDMPDIRTTIYKTDKAKQNFFFVQSNVVFGMNFNYKKK